MLTLSEAIKTRKIQGFIAQEEAPELVHGIDHIERHKENTMDDIKTETFTGMDEGDLNRKVWEWQTKNSVSIIQTHPDEHLPITVKARPRFSKLDNFPDQFSRRVDYVQL